MAGKFLWLTATGCAGLLATLWLSQAPTGQVAAPQAIELSDERLVEAAAAVSVAGQRVRLVGSPSPRHAAIEIVADLAGEGIVRCEVAGMLPDGPVKGVAHGLVEGGVLVGSVVDAQGDARIQAVGDTLSDPPRAVIRWSEAWPGEEGHCDALAPQLVPVTGWVVFRDDASLTDAQVGNVVDGTWPVARDGSFEVACWRGTRCPLGVRARPGEPWGAIRIVVPLEATDGVELVAGNEASEDWVASLANRVAEATHLAQMADPVELALKDPRLSADARPMLVAWLAEQAQERAGAAALLADLRR